VLGVRFRKISVIGLGYVGLPTAALFASKGLLVIGVDVDPEVVDTISQGRIHLAEPDLAGLVKQMVADGSLRATSRIEPADAFIIAVPTPLKGTQPDISLVEKAACDIAPVLRSGNVVIIESTCPVGTTEAVTALIAKLRPDLAFEADNTSQEHIHVAYCPERVLPGRILSELVQNQRSIGGLSSCCAEHAVELYGFFLKSQCIKTSARTAEMVKLAENAFRDVNIAFANELSLICDHLGMDVWEVITLANRHPRVKILQPGPGVGGHCIALDPWFIIQAAPELSPLMRTARHVNESKPSWVLEKVRAAARQRPKSPIACFGLAYKANVNDLRESPALHIVDQLAKEFSDRVLVVEPFISKMPAGLKRSGAHFATLRTALECADIAVLLVDHSQFCSIDRNLLRGKIVIDTRGIWRGIPASTAISTFAPAPLKELRLQQANELN
jgi:UDP-N-acetyl-D-mannosaminuronic acid dehydrogenase